MLGKADKNVNPDEGSDVGILVSTDGGTTWVAAKADNEGRLIVKLTDTADNEINPSTEDKQDSILSVLGDIKTNSLGELIKVAYDYVSVNYATSTREIYTFKTGGSGGSTVATVTVDYVDSSKEAISTVALT